MLVTITAVLASRVYQKIQSDEKGSRKENTLDSTAESMTKDPREKRQTRTSFLWKGNFERMRSGSGMERMRTSVVRLKMRLRSRW